MATYEITAPDGHTYRVTAPNSASPDEVRRYVRDQLAEQQHGPWEDYQKPAEGPWTAYQKKQGRYTVQLPAQGAGAYDDLIPANRPNAFEDLVPKRGGAEQAGQRKGSPKGRYEILPPDYDAIAAQVVGRQGSGVDYDALAAKVGGRPAYDPTEGMSEFEKAAAGAGKAAMDLYRGGKQLFRIGDQAALQREIDLAKQADAPLMNTGAGLAGNIAGNFGMLAVPGGAIARGVSAVPKLAEAWSALQAARPIASAVGIGAGTGAAQGALEPVATGQSRGSNMETGAAFGAAGGALPGILARVVKPNTSEDVARLVDEGVRLTPGQIIGGAAKRLEDATTSIPFVGDIIKRAQTRGIEDFNRAGFNRALAPIGERVGPDFNIGREGVAAVEAKIGAAYDAVLDKIKVVPLSDQFAQDVGKVMGMTAELGQSAAQQFAAILKNRVLSKVTEAGTMSAETMKQVDSELGRQVRSFSSSADANQRGLATALRQVQSALRANVEQVAGPDVARELQNANTAWANFVRIQDAASRTGAKGGVFSPAQLTAAVRAKDSSVRKGAFARGDALMQDLAEAGKNVLPTSVPDSGTAGRILTAGGILGGAGHLIAGLEPTTMGMAALGMLPYTNIGGKISLAMMAKRPEFAGPIADLLNAGAPAGAVASGALAPYISGR